MGTESPRPGADVLRRTSQGQASFPELAEYLKSLPNMVLMSSPKEFARYMEDLEAAKKERERKVEAGELPASEIHVKVTDVESPRLHGIQTQTGFVPRVFTSDDLARQFAVASGLIEPDAALPFMTKDWVSGFQEFLFRGYVGLVVDDGSDHKINLERISIARIYGYMTFNEFAALPDLHIVLNEGKILYQQPPSGGVQAFVYDNDRAASYGLTELRKTSPVELQKAPLRDLVHQLLRAGVTLLVINHALPDARTYNRDDLVKMTDRWGAPPTETSASASSPPVDPSLDPQSGQQARTTSAARTDVPESLQRALKNAPIPMVPPPTQNDADAQMLFHEWKNKSEKQNMEVFELLEVLAFQIKLHTLVHGRPVDGLTWPQFFQAQGEENKTITYLYTQEEMAKKAVENDPPENQRYMALSGIEALRWIWSAPRNIDLVGIDCYPNSPAWMTIPNYWVLSAVFPLFYEISDLKKVPSAGLGKLGSLPGARGLKPESVRALVHGWKQLLSLEQEGGITAMIDHDGKGYLPVFSDADQFFNFSSSPEGIPGKPKQVAGKQAPFGHWLEATAEHGGVILDPAGPHPLILEHTDLLGLELWCRRPERGPAGWNIINAIADLYHNKKITALLAGCMVADYPRYWVGLQHTQNQSALLMVPQTDACALFTSPELAKTYLDWYTNLDSAKTQLEGMQPVPVLTRWHTSALAVAAEQFSEIWIDPDPLQGTGLRLGADAMEAALERIDEKLKPRIPGFIWEG
jgi:hypothetical protein